MDKKDIQLLFAFNRWANAQVLDAVSHLEPQQLTEDLSTSHHSVQGTLTHILAAEWIWMRRCRGISPTALLDAADFPDLDSLRVRWIEVEREQKALVDELREEDLERVLSYTNTKGEQWEYPLGQILQHVVNHSSYHRGQVIGMLRQIGADVVRTDFLVYIDLNSKGA